MLNIPTKADGVDTLSATEFNSLNNELKNIIESTGQTLAGGDLFQIAKAAAAYGGAGSFFEETGSVNNYVLSPLNGFKAPDEYYDGLELRFITSTENTGASTINLDSLGSKSLVTSEGNALVSGFLTEGKYVIARYDLANDYFKVEKFIELVSANTGKNLIINGDFSIWQRGTNQTSTLYGSDDRWRNDHNGSTKVHSQQTFTLGQTDVPNNPKYYSRTVATSVAGPSNYVLKKTEIENVLVTSGKEVTLSFWAKVDAAKDMAVEFSQNFGTGGSPSASETGLGVTTFNLTTAWQKFTTTVTFPSVAGKTLGTNNNSSYQLYMWFDAGSTFDDRTNSLGQQSGTFDIANVQLEFGDTATEFEYVSPADQLARCQRYYVRYDGTVGGVGTTFQTNSGRTVQTFPVEMRASPALSISDVADFDYFANNTIVNGATTIALAGGTKLSAELTHIAALTINTPFFFRVPSGWYAFDAEL